VTNLASRLCNEAQAEQILVTQRVLAEVEEMAEAEPIGEFTLKGFLKPVPAFNVTGLKAGESQSLNHTERTAVTIKLSWAMGTAIIASPALTLRNNGVPS
jgi:hypothetical protein